MRVEVLCFVVGLACLWKDLSGEQVEQVRTVRVGLDVQRRDVSTGRATAALLEATTRLSCCVIFLSDGDAAALTDYRDVWQALQQRPSAAAFSVVADELTNTTQRLSGLMPLIRQVRRLSWCTVVVVVSHDPAFLAAFAEWSLRGRLLVWSSRLVVVTRLTLPQLQAILPDHWTFAMMNAVFLNKDFTFSNHHVWSHLPYSSAGAQVVQVASWTPTRGLVIAEGRSLFQEKFKNFHGARVNVTALPFAPFWEERAGPNNTTIYSGTDYNTIAAVAGALNFTFRVLPTSSWAEVARLVSVRVSFLSPVYHNVMPERLERYDFSFVYEYGSLDFSMAPPGLQPRWQALYYPLDDLVWAATLLALLLTPFILVLIIKAMGDAAHGGDKSRLYSGAVFQDMTGMLLGQNLPRRLPTTSSTRVLVAAWLLFAFIIGSAYRGNLTASLTLPIYPPRPESLQELVDTAERITMQPYGVEFRNFFAKSDSPVFQKLASLIDFVPSIEIGQQEAVERKQAHLENKRYQQLRIAERFTRADGSEMLYIGRDSIMPGQAAWPLPHDAPYRPVIDRLLMAVIEGGFYEKWSSDLLLEVQRKSRRKQRELQKSGEEKAEEKTTFTALTITHTQGAFMVLLLGHAAAAIFQVVEVLT